MRVLKVQEVLDDDPGVDSESELIPIMAISVTGPFVSCSLATIAVGPCQWGLSHTCSAIWRLVRERLG